VQADIYDEFKEKFVAKVKQLKVGNPADENTNIGAVVSKPHFDKILKHIAIAKEEDGKILTGGKPITIEGAFKNGFYIEPTVIENLPLACSTNKDEIFGPVVTLNKFETEEEVIALANDNRYGLSATIFTEDLRKAHRVAEKIEAGIVWVNTWLLRDLRTPFGGVKSSGVGREGGFEALRFFTEPKNICIKY
ncbi:MAG: aldehyde dehydrogenase family protein, partial [Bacteroidetes bacterium]|nr:aldehyde dehydrogenase family protein [Bacteroidota bacterium]